MIKTCGNCKNESKWTSQYPCDGCLAQSGFVEYEAKEDDDKV